MRNEQHSPEGLTQLLAGSGVSDPSVRDKILSRSLPRIRLMAHRMLGRFPGLRRWEETDDIVSGTLVRLNRALQDISIECPEDFFRLANTNIRRELIDLVRHHRHSIEHYRTPAQQDTDGELQFPGGEPSISEELSHCDWWDRFHKQVECLPERTRLVFEMIWYHELPRVTVAEVLKIDERSVRRHMVQARQQLIDAGCAAPE